MAGKWKWDINSDNFDLFFQSIVDGISDQQREELPPDVSYNIFRKGHKALSTSTSKLPFLAKLYVIWKAFKGEFFIVVRSKDGGVTADEFTEMLSLKKTRDYDKEYAKNMLISNGTFVQGNMELCDSLSYLNKLSASPAYKLILKSKNTKPTKLQEYRQQMNYIANMLCFYEGNKKKWVMSTGINVAEWYILIALYNGREAPSSPLYKEVFKYSYNSGVAQVKKAFGTLQKKGYIEKFGQIKGVNLKITPHGRDLVNQIMSKYVINF